MPLIADSLLENLELLVATTELFRTKCINSLQPNVERCRELLELSYAFATAYTPELGYDKVTQILDESAGDTELAKKLLDK
ncbi:Fumarate hydratase class II [bioreactor metagenome]|uniref:Fumarate hydratase class II n=1 Tax=bioreactor metagenome TaxID=1076179 RepID=A0A645IEG6_9ZZZZ